jgi:hypothetical protein
MESRMPFEPTGQPVYEGKVSWQSLALSALPVGQQQIPVLARVVIPTG